MEAQTYYVYILASQRNGTLYTGVTKDLERRVWEHRTGYIKGFTSKHNVRQLVWFEVHNDVREVVAREKRIKRWRRRWKLDLIEAANPNWRDLYEDFIAA
ncbi:MAG: GIY-YIG nuclease family protein [Pseudomonadota bacterium]